MDEEPWRRRITPAKPTQPLSLRRGEITRGQARSSRFVRTGPGLYLPVTVERGAPEQRIAEAAQRLPVGGAVTGWAALRMHGVGFCAGLDAAGRALPVPLAVGRHGRLWEPAGVVLVQGLLRDCDRTRSVHDIPVVTPLRAVIDAARLAGSAHEAVVEMDKALGAGVATQEELARYVAQLRGWKGVGILREALPRTSSRVRSPQETRLRLFAEDYAGMAGLLVNATVLDLRGRVIGEVDLLHPDSGTALEYDGDGHLETGQKTWDAVKHDRLRDLGLEVLRVTRGHLPRRTELAERIGRAEARARASSGPRRWSVELRPLDPPDEEVGSDADSLEAETRAWLAGE